ncbi:MAG: biotin transport system permease protein [Sulfitobacter sp.]|jgi:biotin transport system permease protein
MISLTSPVETAAHRWPAGIKLGLLCAVTMLLFAVQSPLWLAVFLAATLVLYALPGPVFLRSGMRRLWVLWPFVGLILLWHLISADFSQGLGIVLRMVTAVALANLVTMTTRISDMILVVRCICTPLRWVGLRTEGIELAIALVVRFTPVLADKGRMLALAWRARASRRVGWRIITPFAVLAIDDAEHLAQALRARGGL